MSFQWDQFTSDPIPQLSAMLSEKAVETHIRTTRYREQRFMYIGHLKRDSFRL